MPHVVVEYTANLRSEADVPGLLKAINAYLVDQRTDAGPVFPIAGIRSRAVERADFCIGDGRDADAAFVHVAITVGSGRDAGVRQRVFDGLFELLKAHFASIHARRGLALSMEAGEFSEAGTWKHNNLHARFSAQAAAQTTAQAAA